MLPYRCETARSFDQAVARIVVRGVVLFLAGVAWSSLDTFDPAAPGPARTRSSENAGGAGTSASGASASGGDEDSGEVGGRTYSLRETMGGFTANGGGNSGGGSGGGEGRDMVMVRVHNDDVHTFDYVTAAFMDIGLDYQSVSKLMGRAERTVFARLVR